MIYTENNTIFKKNYNTYFDLCLEKCFFKKQNLKKIFRSFERSKLQANTRKIKRTM